MNKGLSIDQKLYEQWTNNKSFGLGLPAINELCKSLDSILDGIFGSSRFLLIRLVYQSFDRVHKYDMVRIFSRIWKLSRIRKISVI